MNSAPHLSNEDHRDFEQVLDAVLRAAPHRAEAGTANPALSTEQLRSMALSATALIAGAAAGEYQHYVKLRGELRAPARTARAARTARTTRVDNATGAVPGAGLAAVVAVLAPVLAGTAAVIFLLVGYLLRMIGPAPTFAGTLVTTGWVFGVITAVAILVAAAGLLIAALRNGATSLRAEDRAGLDAEVVRAREAWHQALRERGIMPFLQEALVGPEPDGDAASRAAEPPGRMPQLGYHRPGFSSPEGGPAGTSRPHYSSPKYSSPDYDSPEFGEPRQQPE